MVFNEDSDDQDLCSLADGMIGSNDISFPLKKKARYANLGTRKIFMAIWRAYGGWIEDDTNNSGEPEVKVDLVTTARNLYAFATAQMIGGMEWLDSNGDWNPLKPITIEEIQERGYAETEFMNTPGNPQFYRPVQNGIRIYPDSDSARSNALKARITRDISPFTSASTDVSPGFASMHHEAVGIFMAYQQSKDESLAQANTLGADWLNALNEITNATRMKYKQHFPVIRKRSNIASQYI